MNLRHLLTPSLLCLGIINVGCNVDDVDDVDDRSTASTLPVDLNQGYGVNEIGFRNGDLVDSNQSNQGANLGSNAAPQADYTSEAYPEEEWDDEDSAGGEYEPEYEPEPEPEPNPYSMMIDQETLDQLGAQANSWGFHFEGAINGHSPYELARESWLNLGDLSLRGGVNVSANDLILSATAAHSLGVSSEFSGSIQYHEKVTVKAEIPLVEFSTEAELMSLPHGPRAVVIQETTQSNPQGNPTLREICVIAESISDEDGASGGAIHFSAQDESLETDSFISIAASSELQNTDGQINDHQALIAEINEPLSQSDMSCQCFDESGENQINCDDFDRDFDPNLPVEIPFYSVEDAPLSTFSLDVDTASYTLARQSLSNGALPNPSQIRVEEMVNYFKYNYDIPTNDQPFTVYSEIADCPWNANSKLAMIGIRGQEVQIDEQPPANLVYLLDVSGSMREEMWLIKPAFRLITRQLRPQDTLSIVVYAGHDAVVLDGVSGDQKETILAAIDDLESGGSTNGAMGIERAYQIATENFKPEGNNRVILATDGDFNVGITSENALVELIEEKADTGVFLTIYGFNNHGGHYEDQKMEELSNHGNGTYFFIDNGAEAQRAFMYSLSGTLLTIAKDVKIQAQFNPDIVRGYRLIGYDNRLLNNSDFNNDQVDAGELGNSEEMTAFYELILHEADIDLPVPARGRVIEPSNDVEVDETLNADQIMAIRMRYKLPQEDESELFVTPITNRLSPVASPKFTFASSVAHFGLILRRSTYVSDPNIERVIENLSVFEGQDFSALEELRRLIEDAESLLAE